MNPEIESKTETTAEAVLTVNKTMSENLVELETSQQHCSKYKKPTLILLGIIIFIISALLIYEGAYSILKHLSSSQGKAFAFEEEDFDSMSAGDASVIDAINTLGNDDLEEKNDLLKKDFDNNHSLLGQATSTIENSDIQYVILSFDGSRSINMWNMTRQFSKDMVAKGIPVHFTYFINPIYLVTKAKAMEVYQPPRHARGDSMIGYADSEEDVRQRVEQMNFAYREGNEIGSHAVGHFNGGGWSHDEWAQELGSFDSMLSDVQKNNPDVAIPPMAFNLSERVGFRAPELGVNGNLYNVLSEKKYLYDASGIRMPTKYPTKDKNGVWHIGLGIVKMKETQPSGAVDYKNVLSMDYNFWMTQSHVKNVATKGTPLWNSYFDEMKGAYMDYFNNNYKGNHAPVVIGHHFSLWNDGVYWEAMKSFAEEVCGKPKVKCTTFKDYVDHLNSQVK